MSKLHNISLKVTLCLLDNEKNIAKAKKKEELGEIISFNAKYCINGIPKATVSLPVGDKLLQGGNSEESYVYKEKINELADKRTPVGVFIKATSQEELPGLPKKEFCIFKGFIESCSYTRDFGSATLSVQIAHWLQALTVFPMINTLVSPHSAGSIGRGFMVTASSTFFARITGEEVTNHTLDKKCFSFLQAAINTLNSEDAKSKLWEAIKSIVAATLPPSDAITENDPGYASKELLEQTLNALKAIDGKHLEMIGLETLAPVTLGIADYIASISMDQLQSMTPWDKLISEFLPSFYMSLTPLVNSACVIPIPGQYMSESDCKKLTLNPGDYTSIQFARNSQPLLGGVALAFNNEKHIDVAYRYPKQAKPGPFEFISAPAWMPSKTVISTAMRGNTSENIYSYYSTEQNDLIEKGDTEDKNINECAFVVEKILRSLVRSAYQMKCCQGRTCIVITPFRADITPGTQLKIMQPDILSKAGNGSYSCGTVSSVTMNLNPSNAQTVLEITNLRTDTEMEDEKMTAKEGAFFKDAWTYDDGKLYEE